MFETITGIYITDKEKCNVIDFIGINAYEYARNLKDKTTPVNLKELKRRVNAGEPEYDDDGIYTNIDRHTLKGLLTMPHYISEVMEDGEHYYAMCCVV